MRRRKPIITLDGPAGAGKSTVARRVAEALGLRFLDTGAMYRAVAWKADRLGFKDLRRVALMIRTTRIQLEPDRILCDGEDVGAVIRTPEVTALVRPIAESPECRDELVVLQRTYGLDGGLVSEGRDQGSVVFPDADHKFYLDASVDVRARRRHAELGGDLEEIRRGIQRRDEEDRTRPLSPLVKPAGAVVIDTSALTLDEAVHRILAAIGAP
jgi:cytidylate kinase